MEKEVRFVPSGIPVEMADECRKRLPNDMIAVVDRFDAVRKASCSVENAPCDTAAADTVTVVWGIK